MISRRIWIGWILSILPALFLLADASMKLLKPAFVVEATTQLGYSEGVIVGLGLVLLTCTALYLVPQTSVLGVGSGLFAIFFPVLIGALLWGGLALRDDRASSLIARR